MDNFDRGEFEEHLRRSRKEAAELLRSARYMHELGRLKEQANWQRIDALFRDLGLNRRVGREQA